MVADFVTDFTVLGVAIRIPASVSFAEIRAIVGKEIAGARNLSDFLRDVAKQNGGDVGEVSTETEIQLNNKYHSENPLTVGLSNLK